MGDELSGFHLDEYTELARQILNSAELSAERQKWMELNWLAPLGVSDHRQHNLGDLSEYADQLLAEILGVSTPEWTCLGRDRRLVKMEAFRRDSKSKSLRSVERTTGGPPTANQLNQSGVDAMADRRELLTVIEIAERLNGFEIGTCAKTLNNRYTKEWGNPSGKRQGAFTYDWGRIKGTLEQQFGKRLE